MIFQTEPSETDDDVVFGVLQSIDTPLSAKSRSLKSASSAKSSQSVKSAKSRKSVSSAQAENVELIDDSNLADEHVEENLGDEVENGDILIINHDDENAENISLDDTDGGSGTVDYDDSFQRNESAKSIIPLEERNGSANNNELEVEENGKALESMNEETGDLVEQGEEAVESVDEVDGAPNDPDEEEVINIEDISPPSVPGSAVSRMSLRSAEQGIPGTATVTPRSSKGSAQGSAPQTARSHRSNYSTSARSRNVSASNQPISALKTPRQGSATSQVSHHTITDTVGSAASRKSGRMSAPPTPRSASSHKSNAGGSAKSQTTVVSNENVAETGDAAEEETEYADGTEDANESGEADGTMPIDVTTTEVDPDIENNNNNDRQENEENIEEINDEENTNEADAALADVIESNKEVNLSSFANLYCVAE